MIIIHVKNLLPILQQVVYDNDYHITGLFIINYVCKKTVKTILKFGLAISLISCNGEETGYSDLGTEENSVVNTSSNTAAERPL
ncbi:MAG: hypothetical protein KI793_27305 [Rivularia sp. (in: Bacteria)]|nr:hypothetical protein [Rivularia sp. MS3]